MSNRLAQTASPYLRSHAEQPVHWWPWSQAAFDEAAERGVPVLVSIGYATCHWCHVMARESFADPDLAAYLNEHFVAIKVDREEHPEVDAAYLAAAEAFTTHLGWPLNVFTDAQGRAFHAGVYWPPVPTGGLPAFRQVLESVQRAWTEQRAQVADVAESLAAALRERDEAAVARPERILLPGPAALDAAVARLAAAEDTVFGGFGSAPKFPVAPALLFLLTDGSDEAVDLASRALLAMADSPLRGPDGGFCRYATRQDWSEPHYERMLTDNAQLLRAAAQASVRLRARGRADEAVRLAGVAEGVARYLLEVLRVPGGFASAQDSESVIDGERVEGGWFLASPDQRVRLDPPPLDRKVITGWSGLGIGALASAALLLGRPEWLAAARELADELIAAHWRGPDAAPLLRASLDGQASPARATLEDYGLLADGLLRLTEAGAPIEYALAARRLIDLCISEDGFTTPGGADPVLARHGIAGAAEGGDGATPSAIAAIASAAIRLAGLVHAPHYEQAAAVALSRTAGQAVAQPLSFGARLEAMAMLAQDRAQLLIVGDAAQPETRRMLDLALAWQPATATVAVASPAEADRAGQAGLDLYVGRDRPGAYLCVGFACRMPVTSAAALGSLLVEEPQP